MNAIFIKEVADTVLKGKLVKLNHNRISDDEYIIEINISNKITNEIKKNSLKVNHLSKKIIKIFDNIFRSILLNKFKNNLNKIIIKNDFTGYSVIYSNDINKNQEVKDFISALLNNFNIKEYIIENTVKQNMNKYIDEYIITNNLKTENIYPLFIAHNFQNIDLKQVEDLNQKYKEINIYVANKVQKQFTDKIKRINDKYGSCISVKKSTEKDFRKYNICIFVDKSRCQCIKYKFNKKTCYIDFTNNENDKFNNKYIKLEREMKKNNYYRNKIKELYELYGKITVASAIMK